MLITQKPRYKLKIEYDEDGLNPRTDYDNFGHMICWHSRYNLGDEHDFDEPKELLRELVRKTLSEDEIIDYVKKSKSDDVKLNYNRSTREWELNVYCDFLKKWFAEYKFPAKIENSKSLIIDGILENLSLSDLHQLAEQKNVILPIYLYDHSGLTINNSGFSCPWDSGQIGWIYASHDDIKKEYGTLDNETIDKADSLLRAETKEYDSYLRGECYGFIIEKDGEEIDSCWGFIGSFREALENMKGNVPIDLQYLFDHIDYDCMEYDEQDEDEDNIEF
jgi:hypothetical protein